LEAFAQRKEEFGKGEADQIANKSEFKVADNCITVAPVPAKSAKTMPVQPTPKFHKIYQHREQG
jgi:hypothetical protein